MYEDEYLFPGLSDQTRAKNQTSEWDYNKETSRNTSRNQRSQYQGLQRASGAIMENDIEDSGDVEHLLSNIETTIGQRQQQIVHHKTQENFRETEGQQKRKADLFNLRPSSAQQNQAQQKSYRSAMVGDVSEEDSEYSQTGSLYSKQNSSRPQTSQIDYDKVQKVRDQSQQQRKTVGFQDNNKGIQNPLQRTKNMQQQQLKYQSSTNVGEDSYLSRESAEEEIPTIQVARTSRRQRTLKDRASPTPSIQQQYTPVQENSFSSNYQPQQVFFSKPVAQKQNEMSQNEVQQNKIPIKQEVDFSELQQGEQVNLFQIKQNQELIQQQQRANISVPSYNQQAPEQVFLQSQQKEFGENLPPRKLKELQLKQQQSLQQTQPNVQMPQSIVTNVQIPQPQNIQPGFNDLQSQLAAAQQNLQAANNYQLQLLQKIEQLNNEIMTLKTQLNTVEREQQIKIQNIEGEKKLTEKTNEQLKLDLQDSRKRMETLETQHNQSMDKLIQRNNDENKRFQDSYGQQMDLLKQEKQRLIEDLERSRKIELERVQKMQEQEMKATEKQFEANLQRQKLIFEEQIENLKLQVKQQEMMSNIAVTVENSTSQIQELSQKLQQKQDVNITKQLEEIKLREQKLQEQEKKTQAEQEKLSAERLKLQELTIQIEQNEQKRQEE